MSYSSLFRKKELTLFLYLKATSPPTHTLIYLDMIPIAQITLTTLHMLRICLQYARFKKMKRPSCKSVLKSFGAMHLLVRLILMHSSLRWVLVHWRVETIWSRLPESHAAPSKVSASTKKIVQLPGDRDPHCNILCLRWHVKNIACVLPHRINHV